jgi:MFS family permease
MYAVRLFFWTHFIASVLIPFFQEWGGLSFNRILLLNAWFMIWCFLFEIPTGTVADFLGRRASVALAFVVNAAGLIVYFSHPSFFVFLIAEVLLACAMTLLSGADEALVYDSLKELEDDPQRLADRARPTIARLESFKLGGILIGALLGSVIAARFDVTMPLKAQLVPTLLGFFVALTLYEPTHGRREGSSEPYLKVLTSGVHYFLRHPVLRVLTLDMMLQGALAFMVIWLYQPFLAAAGLPMAWYGSVHAAMVIAQILLLSNVSWLERLLGSQKRLLWMGPIVAGIAYMVLGASRSLPVVIAAIVVAAGFGLSRPALFGAYLNQHIPSEKRATVLSTVSMTRTLAIAVLNPIVGFCADYSLAATMIGLGVAMLILMLVTGVGEEHLLST